MKIAEFRDVVYSLNWSRNDLSGSTQDEFRRCDVAKRLNSHIEAVNAALLEVAPRFKNDIERAESAIKYAKTTIERWEKAQETKPTLTHGELKAQAPRGLYLVQSNTVH